MLTDLALLDAFRRGERGALLRVYDAHKRAVERVMTGGAFMHGKRLSGARREQVKDLIQEVFVRAFSPKARASYDPAQPYEPFLMGLARNVLAEHLRKSMREVPDDDAAHAQVSAPEDDPPEPRLLAETQTYLRGLPDDLRALYKSRFEDAHSQYESAEALGLSRQRVRTLEAKLLDGLRRVLGLQPKTRARAIGDS